MGGGTEETKLAKRDCGILGKEVNSPIQLSKLMEKKINHMEKKKVYEKKSLFFI